MTTKEIYLQFMAGLTEVNKLLLAELLEVISGLPTDKDGNLINRRKTRALLAKVREVIEKVIADSGFFELSETLFDSFDTIIENVQKTHFEVNGIKVQAALLTPQKKMFLDQLKARLLEGGIRSEFALPIEQSLFAFVRNNARIIDLERNIRATVEDNLKRWAGEAARDAVFGYQGAMHDAVKAEYGFNGFIYIGSIRLNTRSQCKKWLGIRKAKDDVWRDEIAWAKKGGTYDKKRVSGFMKGTTLENFSTNRGGFNCLHEAVPTNVD